MSKNSKLVFLTTTKKPIRELFYFVILVIMFSIKSIPALSNTKRLWIKNSYIQFSYSLCCFLWWNKANTKTFWFWVCLFQIVFTHDPRPCARNSLLSASTLMGSHRFLGPCVGSFSFASHIQSVRLVLPASLPSSELWPRKYNYQTNIKIRFLNNYFLRMLSLSQCLICETSF